tara:strand:+ start:255 stop:404 length:150 start_codon:yes stop_codon:yes gene_type:complete
MLSASDSGNIEIRKKRKVKKIIIFSFIDIFINELLSLVKLLKFIRKYKI